MHSPPQIDLEGVEASKKRSSVAILTLDCCRSSSGIKGTRAAGLPAQLTTGFPAAANYLPCSANLPDGGQYSGPGGNDSSYKEWIFGYFNDSILIMPP